MGRQDYNLGINLIQVQRWSLAHGKTTDLELNLVYLRFLPYNSPTIIPRSDPPEMNLV
jgi:hypothetical protein